MLSIYKNFILESSRQNLHKNLLLDQIVPRFRKANKYLFESDMRSNGPLLNPHEGVKFTDDGEFKHYSMCDVNTSNCQ